MDHFNLNIIIIHAWSPIFWPLLNGQWNKLENFIVSKGIVLYYAMDAIFIRLWKNGQTDFV